MSRSFGLEVPVRVTRTIRSGPAYRGAPITAGIPFPKGAVMDVADWALFASDGLELPTQTRALDRWSDGSLRWVLVDAQVTVPATPECENFTFKRRAAAAHLSTEHNLRLTSDDGGLFVETGPASFKLSADAPALFAEVRCDGAAVLDCAQSAWRISSRARPVWRIHWGPPVVEEKGTLRSVVVVHGDAAGGGRERLRLRLRMDFYAGLSAVRTRLTVTNPTRARHLGGFWELGDPGSVLLTELALLLRGAWDSNAVRIRWSPSVDSPFVTDGHSVEIYQESSGGANWASTNHVNRRGIVPARFSGYRVAADGHQSTGMRATPIVLLERRNQVVGVAVPEFWQNFPRAVSATTQDLLLSFLPGQYPDEHELQGGEQKTHEAYLLFGRDSVSELPLEWCRSPLIGHSTPEWYERASAVPYLSGAGRESSVVYRRLVDEAIEGPDTFQDKRERADEYGWRHFGDIYADHEAVFTPLMSHYNNQYDAVAGGIQQFMLTGDQRWWTEATTLAAHVVDIDIYHCREDKSAYNGGLFWHTVHYVDAARSTHRSYPRAPGSNGGGPSAEHNYPTGLMLHYLLTGDTMSRDAAVGLARFVIDVDDGTRTVFRWLSRGYTGLASASRTPRYHGPGRGSGNSLNALLEGHRLTGDRSYLRKAEEIIRRCVHPKQDVDPLNLLDAENRWFYTMFLQALGKYLDHKAEMGELDAMYAYGRDALLRFARWMAIHERPYLDRPELLEYPTETWAAQDLRKSEVFDHAARHADGEERDRFLERAAYFFSYSTMTLAEMPTRTLARPLVLLTMHGLLRACTESGNAGSAPAPHATWAELWPVHERFVPQKVVAVRRAIGLLVAGLGAAAAWLVFLLS